MIARHYARYFFVTGLLVIAAINHPQAHAQTPAARTPLPRNTQFTATGLAVAPEAAANHNLMALHAQAGAVAAGQKGAGSFALPVLPAKDYDATAIQATLNDLMTAWHPAQGEYAGYFTWMPWTIDVAQEAKSLGVLTQPNKVFHINYYNVTPDVGISVESVGSAPFTGAHFTPTSEDTIFVVLDAFSAPVPVAVACNVQHDFASGFVTRLVLESYVSAAQLSGHDSYAGLKSLS